MGIRFFGARGALVAPRGVKSFQSIAVAGLFAAALVLSPQIAQAQFVQQGSKLIGSGASGAAEQGTSVALSADGNTAIVGGYHDNSGVGAVWVYTRESNAVWTQQGSKLTGNDVSGLAEQGWSVALSADGNTAIVGGPSDNSDFGAAWVYIRDSNGHWTQQGNKLIGSDAVAGCCGASQGTSVALSADGNTAIVGGPNDNSTSNSRVGAAWVYTRDSNGHWSQQGGKLTASDASGAACLGSSVALSADGNTAIVGGPCDQSSLVVRPGDPKQYTIYLGAVWVFTRDSNGTWAQQGSKLVGNDAVNGEFGADQGTSVALSADGNTAMVGGPPDNSIVGAAWVYARDGNSSWTQQGSKLVGSGASGAAGQGVSVALSADGNTAMVGGPGDSPGAVWVYTRDGNGAWTQQGSKLVGSGASGAAQQGSSVALSADGNVAIVGGSRDNSFAGAAWVFVHPTIVSVSPNAGPVDGGALVGIAGSYLTGTTGVTFGGIPATGVTVVADTYVVATAPAHAAGTVDVAVTISGGTVTSAGTYAYDIPTGVFVISSANPTAFGQPVTFTAQLAGDGGTPTGSVTFKNGATAIGTAKLISGVAKITTSALAVGSHSITAVYGGHGDFSASVSAALTQTVGKGASKSKLTAAPNPTTPGHAVTLTTSVAAVAPAAGTPGGTVTFRDGTTPLGSVPLSGGVASFSTAALAIGSHNVTARYGGSASWTASASNMVTELVDARVGKPFPVNSFNGSKADVKQLPAVATLAGGSFVVVWQSQGEDGSGYGIYGQIFKAAGVKSGGEFKVNATTKNDQIEPAVAALAGGGFVVVWSSSGQDTSGFGVYAQRYNKNGVRSGGEFKASTMIANDQSQPAVAGLADGGFVVVWTSNKQDGSGLGIYAQRYTKTSARSGGEFRINTTAVRNQQTPSVAALGTGFVVAWASNAQLAFGYDVYGQLFDKNSAKLGGEFLVNTTRTADQTQPVVASSAGGFVVAWSSAGQDDSGRGVYAQRFDIAGAKLGGEFKVNTTTKNDQSEPAIATFADGGFVIVWTSDGSGNGVDGQGYDTNGNALNAEFLINTTTAKDQWQPRVAALSANGFVVVWTAVDPTTSLQGIDAQRLSIGGL